MKVLIIRFSSIGDIVLTSPVIRCLRLQTGAEVHFLTKGQFADLVQYNPYIHRVHQLDGPLRPLLRALRKERFDLVIDLHNNLRSTRIKLGLMRPARTFAKLNLAKWLRVNTPWDVLPRIHIVDRYLHTVKFLGVQNDGAGLDFFIPKQYDITPERIRPDLRKGNYFALAIGANHATKRLPEEQLIELCGQLAGPVVLLGGPAEQAMGARIATAAGRHVINTCGQCSIFESAAVVRDAAAVVAHDTGLMHIAAAFRQNIVSVWGNTLPEFGMYPYLPESEGRSVWIETKGLSCRPCSKIGFSACPQKHFRCMRDIDTRRIAESLGSPPP